MSDLKRVVEMYIGTGSDYGSWRTDYAEIPIDTLDNDIEAVAIKEMTLKCKGMEEFQFTGVYSIPTLEDSNEIMEY
jgi:hypothetical protein